jgi:hypothetical protein
MKGCSVRVPANFMGEVEQLIRKAKRKLPLYVVGSSQISKP